MIANIECNVFLINSGIQQQKDAENEWLLCTVYTNKYA